MKRVLIITYYWPPSGGSGVQRWLKFVKYLRGFGWEPIVYTAEDGEVPVVDTSLEKDIPDHITVIRRPIWEPYSIYKKFVGQKKETKINTAFLTEDKKPKLAEKLSVWIRGNFFIPDARMFWIRPSVKFLSAYLKSNPVDVIVSSGPPHSMHLIALNLKCQHGIPWLADFRDPWTNIDFYDELMLSKRADKKHHRLEHKVLKTADAVISVGETMNREFQEKLDNKERHKFKVISNGYDDDDIFKGPVTLDEKFSIVHIGTMVKTRNPEILWKTLSELVIQHKDFASDLEIKLVGKVDVHVTESIEEYKLRLHVTKTDYLPHSEIVKLQQQSQVLLLIVNSTRNAKGILTGKFFEYLSARRPILCIAPADGDVAKIIRETHAGKVADYSDEYRLKQSILEYYRAYKAGELRSESRDIEKYSRVRLTAELAASLDQLVGAQKG